MGMYRRLLLVVFVVAAATAVAAAPCYAQTGIGPLRETIEQTLRLDGVAEPFRTVIFYGLVGLVLGGLYGAVKTLLDQRKR
ncbi:hypothetical protein Daudx_1935 [Candidatus Desulforudis audaxviator]|nr:hypothetical protein Daudx_1935 [Candidatus Desulforudis audaxviator]